MADFLKGTCSVTNGSNTVTLDGGLNASFVTDGTAIFIDGLSPVQCLTGGVGTITLKEVWGNTSRNNVPFTTINTVEGLDTAISRARSAADDLVVAKTDYDNFVNALPIDIAQGGTGSTTAAGAVTNLGFSETATAISSAVSTVQEIDGTYRAQQTVTAGAVKQALNASMGGMSGFVEWGKHKDTSTEHPINQGMNDAISNPNMLRLGRRASDGDGISTNPFPIVKVDNTLIEINSVNNANIQGAVVLFPEAPNGLQKADGTGEFADLAQAITAGGTDLSASVINRTDLVILEVWDELISDKDLVVPYGNSQFGGTTFLGEDTYIITFLGVAQGYSAFYEGDTATAGRGRTWSTLSDTQKEKWLSEPKNNIRNTPDGLVQRRYRLRTIAGLEGDWQNVDPTSEIGYLRLTESHGNLYPKPQGSAEYPVGGSAIGTSSGGLFTSSHSAWGDNLPIAKSGDKGVFYAASSADTAFTDAYKGFCVAMPIALVERLNQGAYSPELNENGARKFRTADVDNYNTSTNWYGNFGATPQPTGLADLFDVQPTGSDGTLKAAASSTTGYIGAPAGSGHKAGLFYDAIYADQVRDLRIDASRNWDLQRISDYVYQGCANGDFSERETEYLPFTDVAVCTSASGSQINLTSTTINGYNISSNADWNSRIIRGYFISDTGTVTKLTGSASHVQDSHLVFTGQSFSSVGTCYIVFERNTNIKSKYWTDIIGSPSNIAATFPNGVYGAWIPEIPDGIKDLFPFNRKALNSGSGSRTYTNDNGATWTNNISLTFDSTNNRTQFDNMPATQVMLYNYEYAPKFTNSASQARVDFMSGVVKASNSYLPSVGNTMIQSLFDKVGTASSGLRSTTLQLSKYDIFNGELAADSISFPLPQHDTINLAGVDSPAVKYFIYLHINDYNIVEAYVVGKEMVFDSGADRTDDFTDITAGTVTKTAGEKYHVTDGTFAGFWLWKTTTTVDLNNANWVEIEGKLYNSQPSNNVVYAERWNGNGFGDSNKFSIVDGEAYETDYNGNTIKVLCHKINLPFQIYLPRTIKES